jgi:hypothetical protein
MSNAGQWYYEDGLAFVCYHSVPWRVYPSLQRKRALWEGLHCVDRSVWGHSHCLSVHMHLKHVLAVEVLKATIILTYSALPPALRHLTMH